jgi:predicted DNA-binding transcriptional regulator YafY
VLDTSARLLRLLSLLQARPDWSGAELAGRLAVTTRTLRRDIQRLRDLGYPVHAVPGIAGGYRLGAGAAMPPLLLDEDEAVAVAVSLRTAASHSVTGIEETALRALAKLEQVLPSRLRARTAALQQATVPLRSRAPTVSPAVLAELAAACRDRRSVTFSYTGHGGETSARHAEPHRLVHAGYRWYLVARDTQRDDWRTFRADRIAGLRTGGARFVPRDPPDAARFVAAAITTAPYRYHAKVLVHAPASVIAERLPPTVGTVEPAPGCRPAPAHNEHPAAAAHNEHRVQSAHIEHSGGARGKPRTDDAHDEHRTARARDEHRTQGAHGEFSVADVHNEHRSDGADDKHRAAGAHDECCLLTAGADSLDALAFHLAMLGAEFTILGPPELIAHARAAAGRLHRAVPPTPDHDHPPSKPPP